MDKITDKIAALPANAEYVSLEFFPPKTQMGFSNLRDRLIRMERALRPLFVNVTWGAGGSTAQKSLELAMLTQKELGLTTCLHLTCTNMSRRVIDKTLEEAKAIGIRNILALRGDPPRRAEYRMEEDSDTDDEAELKWATDLIKYIRKKHGDYFCIGAAAYPEGHADESHPMGQSLDRDMPHLREKILAGADFIMTQLFFDVDAYDRFEQRLRGQPEDIFKNIHIIPGLMPIQSYQMVRRTTKLSHAQVPEQILARLDALKGDDEKVKMAGVEILSEIIEKIREIKNKTGTTPRGFHFYTLNLEKAVSFILERTRLIPDNSDSDEEAVVDALPLPQLTINGGNLPIPTAQRPHRRSSAAAHNRVIVPSQSTSNPDYELTAKQATEASDTINTRANTLAISEGEGTLGREATWDDFPNGRWGDSRSPAYGEIDGYGVSLHMSVDKALQLWGHPKTAGDITDIFRRHIKGELPAIPWSEEELSAESSAIQQELVNLNSRGWWTVASQPAINGISSRDETFGWGPANGFVFQKAFVEFFLPQTECKELLKRLSRYADQGSVSFYACSASGEFASSDAPSNGTTTNGITHTNGARTPGGNTPPPPQTTSTNAVTWGVFPGKEIVTPTIIEEVSFRAWCDEAFKIWSEWATVYPKGSDTQKLLESLRTGYWLINVIHHEYVDKDALWRLVME